MSLATHCIPYDPECSICNPPTPSSEEPRKIDLMKALAASLKGGSPEEVRAAAVSSSPPIPEKEMTDRDSTQREERAPLEEQRMQKILRRLVNAGQLDDRFETGDPEVLGIINWLANRELYRRSPPASVSSPVSPINTDALIDDLVKAILPKEDAPRLSPLPFWDETEGQLILEKYDALRAGIAAAIRNAHDVGMTHV